MPFTTFKNNQKQQKNNTLHNYQLIYLLHGFNPVYIRGIIVAQNSDLFISFEKLLSDYFQSDNLSLKGIPSVQYFSSALNMSANYLADMLRSLTGQSTQQHIHEKLVEKAKEILASTNMTASEIAFELGFEYPQSFSKLFKKKTGFTPLEYRQSLN